MGNCSNKRATGRMRSCNFIRIMTDSGGIMELEGPLHVRNIVDDFPGYGVFRGCQVSSPLFHHEQLLNGQSYYLLPLNKETTTQSQSSSTTKEQIKMMKLASDEGKTAARLSSVGTASSDLSSTSENATTTTTTTGGGAVQVLPSPGKGVWRVKLVIDTKQLGEILSEQMNTEALIEKMRSAASSSSSSANATPKRSSKGGRTWGFARRPTTILSNVRV